MPTKKKTAAKRRVGRPSFKPTDEQRKKVEQWAAVGLPHEQIARGLVKGGISVPTLHKYFSEELETAFIKANAQVGGAMFKKAMAGDVQAQKWWSACRMGWKDASRVEITGENGNPMETITKIEIVAPNVKDRKS